MKVGFSLLYLSVCFATVISMSAPDLIDLEWDNFKDKYKKNYDTKEELDRKEVFQRNFEKIKRHNEQYKNKQFSYKLGVNQFADWTEADIVKKLKTPTNFITGFETKPSKYEPTLIEIPVYFDWRPHFTFEVKDKGAECKSDWAFAAAGILEGYLYEKTQKFTPLSVQDLIECSRNYGNVGCQEGYVEKAIDYVKEHGIATEKSYPFTAEVGKCTENVTRDGIPNPKIIRCKNFIISPNEGTMKSVLLDKGPIAVKIFAPWKFFFYKEGIFTGEDCIGTKEIDYNVLIVGYNSTEESWIVKNWLGKDWGEQGYVRIARNNNTCEIARRPQIITDKDDLNSEDGN